MTVKQRAPTPVRFTPEQDKLIIRAAKKDGSKKSTWIKKAVRFVLSEPWHIQKINDLDNQDKVT